MYKVIIEYTNGNVTENIIDKHIWEIIMNGLEADDEVENYRVENI